MKVTGIQQMELNLDKPDKPDMLEVKTEILTNLIEVQRSSIRSKDDRYMIGLYNGLVLARSVLTDKEPLFYEEENRFSEMEGKSNG